MNKTIEFVYKYYNEDFSHIILYVYRSYAERAFVCICVECTRICMELFENHLAHFV